jgi:biotin synthase-related radical SAM superfamily protein
MGENNFIPLEQDTIELAVNLGFEYVGKIEMVMSRMIGLDPVGVKNRWFDETTNKIYKTEPILIMKKGEDE